MSEHSENTDERSPSSAPASVSMDFLKTVAAVGIAATSAAAAALYLYKRVVFTHLEQSKRRYELCVQHKPQSPAEKLRILAGAAAESEASAEKPSDFDQ